MKFTALFLFLSTVGMASDFSTSEFVKALGIMFGSVLVPVTQLCIDGDSIRPLNPNYTRLCGGESDCTPEAVYLSRKLVFTAEVCTNRYVDQAECPSIDRRLETFRIPTTYTLAVYGYNASGDDASQTPTAYQKFDVPRCGTP